MQTVDIKTVRLHAACDSLRFSEEDTDLTTDQPQYAVSEIASVHGIDKMELLYVDHNGIHMHLAVIPKQSSGIFEEKVAGIQAGQSVCLGGGNQFLSFYEFQNPVDTRQDDFRNIKWLGDEVGCSHLKCLQFCALIRSQHNHRDVLQLLILLHMLQHLISVHHRHIQIQEQHRELVPVTVHHLQRFFSILREQELIVVFQDDFERVPVDLNIIRN